MGLTQVATNMLKSFGLSNTSQGDVLTFDGNRWIAQPGLPPGSMIQYAGASPPNGWLLCDGSAVSRASYAGLFAAIGTVYGAGNGSTTFNLPDMRGRTAIGLDSLGGTSANRITATQADVLGGNGGAETHTPAGSIALTGTVGNTTLSVSQTPAHTHVMPGAGAPYSIGTDRYGVAFINSNGTNNSDGTTSSIGGGTAHNHSFTGSGTLTGTSFDTTPPWLALTFIIKI
jgi:microcystin-dependent protein